MEHAVAEPRKRQVLIVDDNAPLAHFFHEILRLHGYEATVFSDGVAALKHALQQHTDAVICDLQMPQLDGDLFYATVERANPTLARRFIFVTGVADDPKFQKFVSAADSPVLRKPVPVEELLEALQKMLV